MSLANDYRRQFAWRAWPTIFDALPPLGGRTILDLGCGVGDQAAELVARGAYVIGLDMNDELLREAQSRRLASAEFRMADLRNLPELGVLADGLWSSFTAAYFPNLADVLASWGRHLRPGAWIALTEVDDLFGHEPLAARTRFLLDAYAEDALAAERYDFHMGSKLSDYLQRAGFTPSKFLTVEDHELAFSGPARPEIIDAWRTRFDRMKLLADFCGAEFDLVREDFLSCLARPDHLSEAKVYCSIGTK
jgi:SAM-dependent methyltransferase